MFQSEKSFYFKSPRPLNILEGLKEHPDFILEGLQKCTNYFLTLEQYALAKFSALELAEIKPEEITILDLVENWSQTPSLSDFARVMRQGFLPN
jgi:hypothetical protein